MSQSSDDGGCLGLLGIGVVLVGGYALCVGIWSFCVWAWAAIDPVFFSALLVSCGLLGVGSLGLYWRGRKVWGTGILVLAVGLGAGGAFYLNSTIERTTSAIANVLPGDVLGFSQTRSAHRNSATGSLPARFLGPIDHAERLWLERTAAKIESDLKGQNTRAVRQFATERGERQRQIAEYPVLVEASRRAEAEWLSRSALELAGAWDQLGPDDVDGYESLNGWHDELIEVEPGREVGLREPVTRWLGRYLLARADNPPSAVSPVSAARSNEAHARWGERVAQGLPGSIASGDPVQKAATFRRVADLLALRGASQPDWLRRARRQLVEVELEQARRRSRRLVEADRFGEAAGVAAAFQEAWAFDLVEMGMASEFDGFRASLDVLNEVARRSAGAAARE